MKPRIGLVVVFASLNPLERNAIDLAWLTACNTAHSWSPSFIKYSIDPLDVSTQDLDLLVYLGESSRFDTVAGELNRAVPVLLIKSTVEELMEQPAHSAARYRISTGVNGIGKALAQVAPHAPTVDWTSLPWPDECRPYLHLDEAEQRYVTKSLDAFRAKAEQLGKPSLQGLPPDGGAFSVFLTMHDPAAAQLAHTALTLWPQCTVLTADGMVSTSAPDGQPWPERLVRVRHWSPEVSSASNQIFSQGIGGQALPDFDSPGMTFGALTFLDHAFEQGARPEQLFLAGEQPGPLGPMRLMESGKCRPERLIIHRGSTHTVLEIDE